MAVKLKNKESLLSDYGVITLAAMLMALNYYVFILPNQFAPSGLGGINTMIQYVFHISVGWLTLVMNIPLAIVCWFTVDRQFTLKTVVSVVVFSVTLLLMQNRVIDVHRFIYFTGDGRSTLLAPVAAGTINGMIEAASLRAGGSTGGMDYVSAMIHKKHPAYSMTHITFTINLLIASASYVVYDFQIEPVILCIVYSFVTTQMGDAILRGGKTAMKVEMITAHPREITDHIVRELHHSTTILQAEGGFSHQGKTMLITVVGRHQITKVMDIISQYPDTFACVSQVSETVGNFNRRPG
ncbi:MAG: YitT family protein [Clostridia bacterium]|nr:YitT family protein [Clostridia bacterium]